MSKTTTSIKFAYDKSNEEEVMDFIGEKGDIQNGILHVQSNQRNPMNLKQLFVSITPGNVVYKDKVEFLGTTTETFRVLAK